MRLSKRNQYHEIPYHEWHRYHFDPLSFRRSKRSSEISPPWYREHGSRKSLGSGFPQSPKSLPAIPPSIRLRWCMAGTLPSENFHVKKTAKKWFPFFHSPFQWFPLETLMQEEPLPLSFLLPLRPSDLNGISCFHRNGQAENFCSLLEIIQVQDSHKTA